MAAGGMDGPEGARTDLPESGRGEEVKPFPSENGAFCACRDGGASEARVSVCAMYAPNRLLELSSMTTATIHK